MLRKFRRVLERREARRLHARTVERLSREDERLLRDMGLTRDGLDAQLRNGRSFV